jgi:Holliday junction DNA helicase RuvA
MIGYVSGLVKAVHKNYLIIAADQVGYKVFVTPQLLLEAAVGKQISLFIHTYVREDQLALYGFLTLAELDFFELLLSVSGIGPKLAMSIMSLADLEVIKSGIINEDPLVFTKVSGVGRKIAERLIVELKEKVADFGVDQEAIKELSKIHAEVLDALMALGYSRAEARKAIAVLPTGLTNSDDKIREALRALAKQ